MFGVIAKRFHPLRYAPWSEDPAWASAPPERHRRGHEETSAGPNTKLNRTRGLRPLAG